MTSPFASCGVELFEKGISVIPIEPGHKYPARYDGEQWRPFKEWERHARRLANEAELDAWETWPDCGIGVVLGELSNLVVIDIDVDDPAMQAAIEAVLPPSPVRKRGSLGYSGFYQHNGEHTQRFSALPPGASKPRRVVEMLSNGTQTVLPPSLHPSGERYQWQTVDTLANIDTSELPSLPTDFAQRLVAALEPWAAGQHGDIGSGLPVGDEVPDYQISGHEFAQLREAVLTIPYENYEQFIKIGMCLRTIGGEGFGLWLEWAELSPEWRPGESPEYMRKKWYGFRTLEGGVTWESIYKMARAHGWVDPPLPDYAAQLKQGAAERAKKAAKTGLYITDESDLGELKAPHWLIKKHLVADSMAMLYGASGGGKSFCAIDMGLCVAAGVHWHGAPVEQGRVLYVAGEGGRGLNARIVAWRRHHDIEPGRRLPFGITSQPVPLLDRQRVNELMKVMAEMAEVPKLIIVDTLNRNFGDGDENTTKDMTNFVDALGHLQMVTGACVLVVHHTGKGDSELARGNSSLRAAMDTEAALKVSADGIQLVCTKQKDAGEFAPKSFELRVLELGTDEDGEEITSCVLAKSQASTIAGGFVEAQKAAKSGPSTGWGVNQKKLLRVLRRMVNDTQRADGDTPREVYTYTKSEIVMFAEGYDLTKRTLFNTGGPVEQLTQHGIMVPSGSGIYMTIDVELLEKEAKKTK